MKKTSLGFSILAFTAVLLAGSRYASSMDSAVNPSVKKKAAQSYWVFKHEGVRDEEVVFKNPLDVDVNAQVTPANPELASEIGCAIGDTVFAGSGVVKPGQEVRCKNSGELDDIAVVNVGFSLDRPVKSWEEAKLSNHDATKAMQSKVGAGDYSPEVLAYLTSPELKIASEQKIEIPASPGSMDLGPVTIGDYVRFSSPDGKIASSEALLKVKASQIASTGISRPKDQKAALNPGWSFPGKNRFALVCAIAPKDGSSEVVLFTAGEPEKGLLVMDSGELFCGLNLDEKARKKKMAGSFTVTMLDVNRDQAYGELQKILDRDSQVMTELEDQIMADQASKVKDQLRALRDSSMTSVTAYNRQLKKEAAVAAAKSAEQDRLEGMKDSLFVKSVPLTFGVQSAQFSLKPKLTPQSNPLEGMVNWVNLEITDTSVNYVVIPIPPATAGNEVIHLHQSIFGPIREIPTTQRWSEDLDKKANSYSVCAENFSRRDPNSGADLGVVSTVRGIVGGAPQAKISGVDKYLLEAKAGVSPESCHRTGLPLRKVVLARQDSFLFCFKKTLTNKIVGREPHDLVSYDPDYISVTYKGYLDDMEINRTDKVRVGHPFFSKKRLVLPVSWEGNSYPDLYCVPSNTIDPVFDAKSGAITDFSPMPEKIQENI